MKTKFRNGANQVPHLARNTILESDKRTRKHRAQENLGGSHLPLGDLKPARNGKDKTKTHIKHKLQNNDPQKKHHLGTVSKKTAEELKHAHYKWVCTVCL